MYKKNSLDVYNNAVEYMRMHLLEKIYVADIAMYCGISASGLEKNFAKFSQSGVMRYFLDLKLEYAANMLKKGYAVNYIAKLLNFSSTAHFSVAFKNKYGKSPIKYKYQFL